MDILAKHGVMAPIRPALEPELLNDVLGLLPLVLRDARDPFLCFNEGGGGGGNPPAGGGGGGNPPPGEPPKTFTQADVDKMIQARLAKEQAKFADYDAIKEKAGKVDTLSKELEDIKVQLEDAGKTADQKAKAEAERAAKAQLQKIEDADKRAAAAEAKEKAAIATLTAERIANHVTAALGRGEADPRFLSDAVKIFMSDAKIELTEDGRSITVEYNDGKYKDPVDAAKAWLRDKPNFAKAPAGGSGGAPPGGFPPGSDPSKMSPTDLAVAGLRQLAGKVPGL